MTDFNPSDDEELGQLLALVHWCLVRYFDQKENVAKTLVTEYYERFRGKISDDHYHHDGAWEIATKIYYHSVLKLEPSQYVDWRTRHGHNRPPDNYFERLRTGRIDQD